MKLSLFKPVEKMNAAEWAVKNVVLDNIGKFSFKTRPFFEEPTIAMSQCSYYSRVVITSSAQLSKSTMLMNMLGWIACQDPATTLFIMDSQKSINKVVKQRIRPFLRNIVKLASLQPGKREYNTDRSNSAVNISVAPGISFLFGSAKSMSDLCSTPAKYVLGDEVSRFTDNNVEGSPIELLKVRMLTYPNSMMILASTPTTVDGCITQNYLVGTQEEWGFECECGKHICIDYFDIDFSNPDKPTYTCKSCGQVYTEEEVIARPHKYSEPNNPNPVKDERGRIVKSYNITAANCPEVYSWKVLRQKEIEAQAKSPADYKAFVNVVLGMPYHPSIAESLSVDTLMKMSHYYTPQTLPSWVKNITMGIDTQDNRFEYIVIGFSKTGENKCFIERGRVEGNLNKPQVWTDLMTLISNYRARTISGVELNIKIVCIDSGGHFTQDVYAFATRNNRIRAIKGMSYQGGGPIIHSESIKSIHRLGQKCGQVQLTIINTLTAKDKIRSEFLAYQRNERNSHIVISREPSCGFNAEFFGQMDSEIREVNSNGHVRWTVKGSARNEMLDCTVYAYAAYEILRVVLGQIADFNYKPVEPGQEYELDEYQIRSVDNTYNEVKEQDSLRSQDSLHSQSSLRSQDSFASFTNNEVEKPVKIKRKPRLL